MQEISRLQAPAAKSRSAGAEAEKERSSGEVHMLARSEVCDFVLDAQEMLHMLETNTRSYIPEARSAAAYSFTHARWTQIKTILLKNTTQDWAVSVLVLREYFLRK